MKNARINVNNCCHYVPTDMFLAGFSCKSVSALSNDDEQRRASISDYCGTTGLTFWGVVMVLSMTKPATFVLENVEGLMRHNLHLLVVDQLVSLGYVVLWRLCDAKELGFPHHRPRIWFVGWRADSVPCISSFQRRMAVVMEALFVEHPHMDLEQFFCFEKITRCFSKTLVLTQARAEELPERGTRPRNGLLKARQNTRSRASHKQVHIGTQVFQRSSPSMSVCLKGAGQCSTGEVCDFLSLNRW